MDADLISYESMLTARDSANWAYWSMIAAFCSAGATLLAAIIALLTVNVWRRQSRAQELKNFSLAVYNYHNSIIRAPNPHPSGTPNELEQHILNQTFHALSSVYETTLMIHMAKTRAKASLLFSQLSEVQNKYFDHEITGKEASDKILQLRTTNRLLKSSY
ncbi:hypothetical protein [Serratia marcescens]|uniref:hypothetical protein n=1 Tax=Serratia marcescens TaxID=615 RepID=UPI0002B857D6|nr:hypothetical protein [Serratia marcescens]EMF02951.1 hypothetical protein F518_24571 [Serratia marcescens VGH107]